MAPASVSLKSTTSGRRSEASSGAWFHLCPVGASMVIGGTKMTSYLDALPTSRPQLLARALLRIIGVARERASQHAKNRIRRSS